MSAHLRYTNEEIIEAYHLKGSIWRAAKSLGCCGQSLWERLKRMGYSLPNGAWSDDEVAELRAIASECTLGEVGRRLGRSYASVACKVSELGIGTRFGNSQVRKVKRGSGLTKPVMAKHAKDLANWTGSAKQFCRQRGLDMEIFVQAMQIHEPDAWTQYVSTHSELASAALAAMFGILCSGMIPKSNKPAVAVALACCALTGSILAVSDQPRLAWLRGSASYANGKRSRYLLTTSLGKRMTQRIPSCWPFAPGATA